VCYAAVGFLHGLLSAIIKGGEFRVEETMCRAKTTILPAIQIAAVKD
jgi:predicted hydrocarbon binding protein